MCFGIAAAVGIPSYLLARSAIGNTGAMFLICLLYTSDEAASRAYMEQLWAEAMTIYRNGDFKLSFSPEMVRYLKEHQRCV